MRYWIATDADGQVVGRWEASNPPSLEDYQIEEVDSLDDHPVDRWFDVDR
jgi:hypothetical protein